MKDSIIETTKQLQETLERISFKNTVLDFKWRFEYTPIIIKTATGVEEYSESAWLLFVSFERPDTITGEIGRGRGRDEIIKKGTTLSGVVKTAWLLVELMIRHELMEGFRFDGQRIFNPHNSVLELAAIQKD